MTRRDLLRAAVASGVAALGAARFPVLRAYGAMRQSEAHRVGLLLQGTGPFADAASAAALGADLGASEATRLAEMLQKRFDLISARTDGSASATREALRLIEEAGVFAIAGALDRESCLALNDLAEQHGFLFVNILNQSDELRGEGCSRNTFHVGASTAMYSDACAEWLVGEAELRGWHFVTSDSVPGQAVYRRARRALLERGGTELGNTVVPSDSQLERSLLLELQESSPDLVFTCLAEDERTAFLRLYNQLQSPFEVAGPFPSPLRSWVGSPEARAGIWPTLWHHKLFKYGAEQLSDRFDGRFERPMDGPGWAGWMAVKVLAEATLRARTTETGELVRFLETERAEFDGHKGRGLTFRAWDHQLRQPVYLIRLRPQARDEWDVFDAVAELPRGEPAAGQTAAGFLDQLGDTDEEARCSFGQP